MGDENIEIGDIDASITIGITGEEEKVDHGIMFKIVPCAIGHETFIQRDPPVSIRHNLTGQPRKTNIEHIDQRAERRAELRRQQRDLLRDVRGYKTRRPDRRRDRLAEIHANKMRRVLPEERGRQHVGLDDVDGNIERIGWQRVTAHAICLARRNRVHTTGEIAERCCPESVLIRCHRRSDDVLQQHLNARERRRHSCNCW